MTLLLRHVAGGASAAKLNFAFDRNTLLNMMMSQRVLKPSDKVQRMALFMMIHDDFWNVLIAHFLRVLKFHLRRLQMVPPCFFSGYGLPSINAVLSDELAELSVKKYRWENLT